MGGREGFEEDGFWWEGTREELEAWKRYKQRKAIAFVQRGYSVSWYPDPDAWMEIYVPERHQIKAPEIRAGAKFYSESSEFGIDGGRISKLSIQTCRTDLTQQVLGRPFQRMRMLYEYDRGLDVDHLARNQAAQDLYTAIIDELN